MITSDICSHCEINCCEGCKHLTSTGCLYNYGNRFLSCKLYPFWVKYSVSSSRPNELFICLTCPHWKEFIQFEHEAKDLM